MHNSFFHHWHDGLHRRFMHRDAFRADGDDAGRHDHHHDHHDHHAAGGRGRFGGRHGGDFLAAWSELRGGGRRGGGRVFGHGDLRLLLLALIEQQPRHGYELIRIIEDMFHGQYSPSPGAIYPTLTMLEELGHAEVASEEGGRKLYAITDDGRAYLDANREEVEAVMARTERSAKMAARMAMPDAVHRAMHALRHAMLMRGSDWGKAEAQRVAAIIEHAAREIARGKNDD